MYTYALLANTKFVMRSDNQYVPTTDPANSDYIAYLAWVAVGNTATPYVAPVLTQAAQITAVTTAIQAQLDATAQAHGYDDCISACSYAAQAVGAPFQAEGAAFLAWRSAVWAQAYVVLAEVQAGTATMMTPAQGVADMPPFVEPS